MNKHIMILTALVVILCGCSGKPAGEGKITVDLSTRGADVPASMYGVFFEEINHAGDGGLYAELVQNRSFEEKSVPVGYTAKGDQLLPAPVKSHLSGKINTGTYRWSTDECPGWSLETKGDIEAKMQLTTDNPLYPSTPNSLKINISKQSGEVSLINGGYWGMGLTGGDTYHLRFFMQSGEYAGTVTIRLLSADGKVLSEAPVAINSRKGWNEYMLDLVPGQSDGKAKMAISFKGAGSVRLDYVSLMPAKTFKNRSNGLRKDVAEFLAELKPAFIRWPGGCIVEGITLSNRVEWKKTLGDPAVRSGEYDTWGYRNSYGFGYHEFLQYCEDIGAKGMFVCNVGLGCEWRSADACADGDVQYYINDVLDAVEYAIGDKTTVWGEKRVAAGHPEPFPLQYVEIGNENWGPVYNQRFSLFYNAIKEKYPQLTLISNHGLGNDIKDIKTDMIDPHWYVNPDFFFRNAGIFDKEPRGDYKVYVGEYACNSGVGSGNMLAALSEAAFITGMERNSDLVKMASYAPLFENSNDRTWPVNLIWMNSTQVIGRSSYYVQKMFAENRPGYNLKNELTPRPIKPVEFKADGKAGAGTWLTQSQYKEFRLKTDDGKTLRPVLKEMVKMNEEWVVSDSVAEQKSDKTMTGLMCPVPVSGSFTYELKARKTGGAEGFLIYFGMSDGVRNGYLFNIGGWSNTKTALEKVTDGSNSVVSEMIPQIIETGRWYDIKVVVNTEGAELWIDGAMAVKYRPTNSLRQFLVSGYDDAAGEIIIKVVNAEEEPWNASVNILNASLIEKSGKVITLSAKSLGDENSFAEPMKITPVSSEYSGFSTDFVYRFEPNSFTVLRIKAKQK